MKRILYIQHAGAIGGSAISLKITLEKIDRTRFSPIVGLVRPSEAMKRLYADIDVQTVFMPDITTYEHSTGFAWGYTNPAHWIGRWRQRINVKKGAQATVRHVKSIGPNLVHLNSVVLLPSAVGLSKMSLPFIWHVREHPAPGLTGRRLLFMRRHLMKLGSEILFLSDSGRDAWLGGTRRGIVLPNYVDLSKFLPDCDRKTARSRLGIATDAPVVLFMGGISSIKGTIPFLESIRMLRKNIPTLRALMPMPPAAKILTPAVRMARCILPIFGSGTYYQRANKLLNQPDIADMIIKVPFFPDTMDLYAACDLVAFPATAPHFARPVIEAAAMAKPAVVSDLPGTRDTVIHNETGLLIRAGHVQDCAAAIGVLITDKLKTARFGMKARERAEKLYNAERSINILSSIYGTLIPEKT